MSQIETTENHSVANKDHQKKAKEKRSKEEEGKCLPITTIIKLIITIFFWLLCIGIFIWYVVDSVEVYLVALPVTSMSYQKYESIPYPAVTVCNFNALIDCTTCGLSLHKTYSVNASTGTPEEATIPNKYVEIDAGVGGLFRCITFNNNSALHAAEEIGYSGSYSLYFHVPKMATDRNNRYGLQVSFHEPGTTPDVFAETNFCLEEADNSFVLSKVRTQRVKATKEEPNLESVRWSFQRSSIALAKKVEGLIVISFSYGTLNESKNKEVRTATIEKILGEISAILVALMGIDGLKFFNAVIELGYSFKKKTLMNVWKIFNKGRW
ncbi:predicted protein [Naegleria gruberi]|uniref:Predicted protein n=1 Tax=Naegleria gruberi TaxID=5762 RepID=D2V012_NAEGR|nr:uncharacterized protein NAEGRDRAFT_62132 [Naegleria gruberi]EFC49447.1 predicted protein [Naegleria gruberi]|eukprot:XP_002682191.1 predicted protein [Naegleria gruberi strain NEG-M]